MLVEPVEEGEHLLRLVGLDPRAPVAPGLPGGRVGAEVGPEVGVGELGEVLLLGLRGIALVRPPGVVGEALEVLEPLAVGPARVLPRLGRGRADARAVDPPLRELRHAPAARGAAGLVGLRDDLLVVGAQAVPVQHWANSWVVVE